MHSPLNSELFLYQEPSKLLIFTLENHSFSADLAEQMKNFGWFIFESHSLATLASDIQEFHPSALLFEAQNSESYTAIMEWVNHHQTLILPIAGRVFCTAFWDWQTRLAAVRAGFNSFMLSPPDPAQLADQLDFLTHKKLRNPYRILIVCSEDKIQYFFEILNEIGVELDFIHVGSEILNSITELKPELILIADPLNDYNSYEVSKIIRQDSAYLNIPIILLPNEKFQPSNNVEKVIYSIDQVIQPPFTKEYLQLAVAELAKRFRLLTEMIRRDGLTNILNHAAFKSRLDTEIVRARRSNINIVLAMIDIDFFKEINDQRGHLIGDRVIKGIAKYLKKRLRRPDLIGRYGGEEFAIALLDTSLEMGVGVAKEIKTAISQLVFDSHKGSFSCTVSIGIAAFPEHGCTMSSLIEKADIALYAAKRAGRNRVSIYSSLMQN